MILWRRDEGGLLIISGGRSLKSWDGSDHKGKVRIVLQEIQEKYIWKQKSFTLITFQSLMNDNIRLICLTGKNQLALPPHVISTAGHLACIGNPGSYQGRRRWGWVISQHPGVDMYKAPWMLSWFCIVTRVYKKREWLSRTSLTESPLHLQNRGDPHTYRALAGQSQDKMRTHCLNSEIFALGYEWQPSPFKRLLAPM